MLDSALAKCNGKNPYSSRALPDKEMDGHTPNKRIASGGEEMDALLKGGI